MVGLNLTTLYVKCLIYGVALINEEGIVIGLIVDFLFKHIIAPYVSKGQTKW